MHTAHEVHSDPQAIANGYLPRVTDANNNEFARAASRVEFDEAPLQLNCAPGHGEHTDALLTELGFSEEEIIDFKVKSVCCNGSSRRLNPEAAVRPVLAECAPEPADRLSDLRECQATPSLAW